MPDGAPPARSAMGPLPAWASAEPGCQALGELSGTIGDRPPGAQNRAQNTARNCAQGRPLSLLVHPLSRGRAPLDRLLPSPASSCSQPADLQSLHKAGPLGRSSGQVPRPGPRGQVPRPGPPGQVHGRRALPPIPAAVCRAPCDLLPAVGQGVHPICTGVNASGQEQPEAAALERSPWGNRRPFQLQDQARTALGTALAILCFGLGCVLGVCLAVCPACWCA